MSENEGSDDFLSGPVDQNYSEGESRWKKFLKLLVFSTFAVMMLVLALTVFLTLNPSWGAALTQQFTPYFFILLLGILVPGSAPLFAVLIVLFILYGLIFASMIRENGAKKGRDVLDTPIGYLVTVGSAIFLVVYIITVIETSTNTPIGGGGITSQLKSNPVLGYLGLIYAPFVEELGFRILPLGLFCFLLVRAHRSNEYGAPPLSDALLAIVIPGKIREKWNISWGWLDWVLIFATSALFGYAHIFFGAWDWGKFIPVFITGIGLAVGFLKFGAYVDIPFHWIFNGIFTIIYLEPSLTLFAGLFGLWVEFVGVVGIIAVIVYLQRRTSGRRSATTS